MIRALMNFVSYSVLSASLAALAAGFFAGYDTPVSASALVVVAAVSGAAISLLRRTEQKRFEKAIDHYVWRQEFDAMARERARNRSDDSSVWRQQVSA